MDRSASFGRFLTDIGSATRILFFRLTSSAVVASTCRGYHKVNSTSALGLGTRLDIVIIGSIFFLEYLFSISQVALSRISSRDFFRDSQGVMVGSS